MPHIIYDRALNYTRTTLPDHLRDEFDLWTWTMRRGVTVLHDGLPPQRCQRANLETVSLFRSKPAM